MYQVLVWFPEDAAPRARLNFPNAARAMNTLPHLFADYPGCDRIAVKHGHTPLFTLTPPALLQGVASDARTAA